jgi:hypothetical protein
MKPLLAVLFLGGAAAALVAAERAAKPPLDAGDVRILKGAGVRADDEGLLAYFRDLQHVQALVGRLGSDSYAEREEATRRLTALGGVAWAQLDRASRSADPEIARRASSLLARCEAAAPLAEDALLAALREVARRKMPGAVAPLLDASPLWERPDLRRAAAAALAAYARPGDADALRRALASPNPHLRTAAVVACDVALGEAAGEDLRRILNDRDEGVRLASALALLNRGDRRSLLALALLLDSADLAVRNRAGRVLRAVAGKDIDFVAYAPPAARARAAAEWRRWVQDQGETARLRLPAPVESRAGKLLLCNPQQGRVVELDEVGRKVWETACEGAWCCEGLPNGHRLVGRGDGRVDEYDAEGKVVWRLTGLPQPVRSVRRLASGNTLVACGTGRGAQVKEFRPNESVAWEATPRDNIEDVWHLPGGRTLAALYYSGGVVELDRQGRVAWQVRDLPRPFSVQRLDSGTTLVCRFGADGAVVEVDRAGQVVWSHAVPNATHAQRLANGHTLIATNEKIVEIDAGGQVVWEVRETGVSHFSAY